MQLDVQPCLTASGVLLLLALLISAFSNIYMDLRRDRGVKSITISVFAGTIVTFIAAVILALTHPEESFFIEPAYLYSFLTDHIDWMTKVFFVIGLFGFIIGFSLVGLYKTMRKDR